MIEGKRGQLAVMACESGIPFGKKVVQELNRLASKEGEPVIELLQTREIAFANTEIKTVIEESIRGADLYIIQDVENKTSKKSVDENLRALKTAIDAARRADAHYITAILPVYPYARQDKQIGRECLTAAQIAEEIENAGADRVLTLDVHNSAIAGFFRKAKFENLHASKNIIGYVKRAIDQENLVVVSPDEGGTKRASYYAQQLGVNLAIIYKERDYSKQSCIERATLLGDVTGKDVLIIDDMISTGGTLFEISKLLKDEYNARKIYLACSLPLFNGPALERFDWLYNTKKIEEVIGTDAVHHGEYFQAKHPWFKEVSVAKYFAKVIYNINNYTSLSQLLQNNK